MREVKSKKLKVKSSVPSTLLRACFLILPFALLSPGCVSMGGLADVLEQAAKSNASVCAEIVGGYGAVTLAPGAGVPVIPGGGGYGRIRFCRTNTTGTAIRFDDDGNIQILHGVGGEKDDVEGMEDKTPSPKTNTHSHTIL